MSKKWLLSLSLALSVSVIAACGGEESADKNKNNAPQEQAEGKDSTSEGEESTEQSKVPEPDLEGIPEVVAEVNGEEIPKEEFTTAYEGQFQQASMQSQMTGQEVNQDQLKEQVAESMIGQKLLIQEAENRGFKASEEDVNKTLDELVNQNGMKSKEEFMKALEKQGMSEKEVRSQLETQVKVDQLLKEEAGDTEPTKEEMQKVYDRVTEQQKQMGGKDAEIPSFEEMKPDLKKQVKMQKEQQAAQKLVKDLRAEADVTLHL